MSKHKTANFWLDDPINIKLNMHRNGVVRMSSETIIKLNDLKNKLQGSNTSIFDSANKITPQTEDSLFNKTT